MSTPLEQFYDSLTTEADLRAQILAPRREEDLHLEFKEKVDRRNGDLGDGERKAFSKALSGFTNADGGVLIFGIETKKERDHLDRAVALKPITGHRRMVALLRDSLFNATDRRVDDVRIEPIDIDDKKEAGYVKCLIPQSDRPPHRANDREYWRRVTGGYQRMEHYELEDAFGRRLRPSLKLSLESRPRGLDDENEELHFFTLNEGRGLARDAGFHCTLEGATVIQAYGPGLQNATGDNHGRPTVTYYYALSVIHVVADRKLPHPHF